MDLVRRALEEARGAARAEGKDVGGAGLPHHRAGWPERVVAAAGLGPGPTPGIRNAGIATRHVAKSRGWSGRVAEGAVFGQWPTVVG